MLINPSFLQGKVQVPPSKSVSHRAIICAALANGESKISNIILSDDIKATIAGLTSLGAQIEVIPENNTGRYTVKVQGGLTNGGSVAAIDCLESGSTLRFLIPLAAALGKNVTFNGRGRLVDRPLDIYYDLFAKQNFNYSTNSGKLPLQLQGSLQSGEYQLRGDVSSQFITGLMFALPLLKGDSKIILTSELQSKGYVDLTIQALKAFGIEIMHTTDYKEIFILGNQQYLATDYKVEADYSQAAFWLVAACLGAEVQCTGLNKDSLQSDKAILDIIQLMGGELTWVDNETVGCRAKQLKAMEIDVGDCPDLVPILAVLASCSLGETRIVNAARLRIKESDRLAAITAELKKIGAKISEVGDSLVICGQDQLTGAGKLDSWADHRIAMALAIATTRCTAANNLTGWQSVSKSYPEFWQEYQALGGDIQQEG